MPVAVEQDRAVFTYIDPGMGTPTELHSRGTAHRPLGQMLRQSGRRVEVVAVAWEQHLLDRAARVLQSWIAGDMSEAAREILTLRQALLQADWDTVERHGGFDAAIEKINQFEQATPASNGREMIDDFRLRGSRPCRHMGGHLTKEGWRTEVAHVVARPLNHPNAPLSEGKALPAVVQVVPGNPYWKRVGTDSPSPPGQSPVRRRPCASPPRTARRGATREGEEVEGATPPFWPLVRHGGGKRVTGKTTPFSPLAGRSLPPQ